MVTPCPWHCSAWSHFKDHSLPYPNFANTQQRETILVFRLSLVLNTTKKTSSIIRALVALFISACSSLASSKSPYAKTYRHLRPLVLIFGVSQASNVLFLKQTLKKKKENKSHDPIPRGQLLFSFALKLGT